MQARQRVRERDGVRDETLQGQNSTIAMHTAFRGIRTEANIVICERPPWIGSSTSNGKFQIHHAAVGDSLDVYVTHRHSQTNELSRISC